METCSTVIQSTDMSISSKGLFEGFPSGMATRRRDSSARESMEEAEIQVMRNKYIVNEKKYFHVKKNILNVA